VNWGNDHRRRPEYFKEEQNERDFTAVAVEPAESPTLTEQCADGHDIQGIGPGFVPDILRTELVDEVRAVEATDTVGCTFVTILGTLGCRIVPCCYSRQYEAKATARKLGRTEGLLVGISAGAALAAATAYADDHPDELVGIVLPDPGERYFSTDLYETERLDPSGWTTARKRRVKRLSVSN
jgi:cysteine synthase A